MGIPPQQRGDVEVSTGIPGSRMLPRRCGTIGSMVEVSVGIPYPAGGKRR
jgi:hypothetical protein